jgi:hypothetical protein
MEQSAVFRRLLSSLCVVVIASATARAAGTKVRIDPGPEAISDAERAIEADPAAGVEHAVILLEESQLNDDYGAASEFQHHVRAKILSNEARELADVTIRLEPDEKLTGWWGFVVLPDGKVLHLEERELIEQSIVRIGRHESRSLHAPLPGVVPGAVIDYGYTSKGEYVYGWRSIALQRRWPVRKLVYRWKPTGDYSSAYRVYRHEGLDIQVTQGRDAVLLVARDLPGVVEEPHMPPEYEVRASMTLYYMTGKERFKSFWKDHAADIDRRSRGREPSEVARQALAAVEASGAATLPEKLKAAYDWIGGHVENPLVQRDEPGLNAVVTSAHSEPPDQLFAEVARALGAEAHVVLAPDRRERLWDPDLKSLGQLPVSLVAVRAPGAPDEAAIVTDPSSGLPFGLVPWWSSGVRALLATPDDVRPILVPASSPADSTTHTEVGIDFDTEGAAMTANWESIARGHAGLNLSQLLSSLSQDDRRAFCGEGPDARTLRAEFGVLPSMTSRLRCAIEIATAGIEDDVGRYDVGWSGPWIAPLPDLPVGARVHPVLLDFPQVEFSNIEVRAPAGFVTAGAPDERTVDSSFGKYRARFSTTPEGYRVERALAQLVVLVPSSDYDALRAFYDGVRDADRTPLTFVRKGLVP